MTDETKPTAEQPAAQAKQEKPFKSPVTLQPEEKVLKVLRRHWIHLLKRLGFPLLYGIAGSILGWVIGFASGGIGMIVALVVWVYCLGWAALNYYKYRNDMWLVTNQRLVDSNHPTPIRHIVSSADLINVEDIHVDKKGLFQTILDYGDVVCQTAGVKGNFTLYGIGNPTEVLALIDHSRDEARKRVVSQQAGSTLKGVSG